MFLAILFLFLATLLFFECKEQFNVGDAMSMSGRCVKVISTQTLVGSDGKPFQVPMFCYLYKKMATDEAVYFKPAESHYWWSNENVNCSSEQLFCGTNPIEKSN